MRFGEKHIQYCDQDESISGGDDEGGVDSYWAAKDGSLISYKCPFCKSVNRKKYFETGSADSQSQESIVTYCERCGWWSFQTDVCDMSGSWHFLSAKAVLRAFDPDGHRGAEDG